MTTEEIEALYLKHKEDFRRLLDQGEALAAFDGCLLYAEPGCWVCEETDGRPRPDVFPSVAIAAMTETWRDWLEKEHGVRLLRGSYPFNLVNREVPVWAAQSEDRLLCVKGWKLEAEMEKYSSEYLFMRVWVSLPEAICGVVEFLAGEKRKQAEKPGPGPPSVVALHCSVCGFDSEIHVPPGPPMPRTECRKCGTPYILCRWFKDSPAIARSQELKPSAAAMRAAERLCHFWNAVRLETLATGIAPGGGREITAALIDEEFAKGEGT